MRVLKRLLDSWSVCWATTYTFEPAFYDHEVLGRLGDQPLNAVVLADDLRLTRTLDDIAAMEIADQWSLRRANRAYLLRTVRLLDGVFHPKTVLVGNSKRGLLLVGSGNIGFGGLDQGREVFSEFDSDTAADASAFAAWRDWMANIVTFVDDRMLSLRWLALRGELLWLPSDSAGSRFIHNWSEPIADQFLANWSADTDEVHFTSPFFDAHLSALTRIVRAVRPNRIVGYLGDPTSVDGKRLGAFLDTLDADVSIRAYVPETFIHAKLVGLVAGNRGRLLSGSANLSTPALLHTSASGNAEAAVVTHLDSDTLRAMFVPAGLELRPLDTSALTEFTFRHDAQPPAPMYRLVAATVELDGLVTVSADPDPDELLLSNGYVTIELSAGRSVAAVPDAFTGLVWLVRGRDERVSNAVPIGHRADLDGALQMSQRKSEGPRDLELPDLVHPLGQLLADLNNHAVFDISDTPAYSSVTRTTDSDETLTDDERWELLLRDQLLEDPRAAAYRKWAPGRVPDDDDDFAWLVAEMLHRTPVPNVVRLPRGGELVRDGPGGNGTPWTIDRRAADRAIRVIRRWIGALTDDRVRWYGNNAPVRHYVALLWAIAEIWPKGWITDPTLRDLTRELLASFIHGGQTGGYLDSLFTDEREAALDLLRATEAPELAAAVSFAALRRASPDMLFAWQAFLGPALDAGVLKPTVDAAAFASKLVGGFVSEAALRDRFEFARHYTNDPHWCQRMQTELGLDKVQIITVNAPEFPFEVSGAGLDNLLTDRRVVILLRAAALYKTGIGIRLRNGADVLAVAMGRRAYARVAGRQYSSTDAIQLSDLDRLVAEDLGFGALLEPDAGD